jgi:hypothetical protein
MLRMDVFSEGGASACLRARKTNKTAQAQLRYVWCACGDTQAQIRVHIYVYV